PIGLKAWSAVLANGGSRADVVRGVLSSAEANANSVIQSYSSFLRRAPDEGGFNVWSTALGNGLTKNELLVKFLASDEYLRKARRNSRMAPVVKQMYLDLLGVPPTAAELDDALDRLGTFFAPITREQLAL